MVSSWSHSPYHTVIDAMFPTFATAAQLAWLHGSRSSDVEVAILTEEGASWPHQMKDLWARVFGSYRRLRETSGCYRYVVYGFLYWQRPVHFPDKGRFVDPAQGPWAQAFAGTLRRVTGMPSARGRARTETISRLRLL